MKKIIILVLVCLVAATALAANNKSVIINTKTSLNGQPVAPGHYTLTYDVKGNTADLKLTQDGKTVATATGQIVEVKDPTPYDSVVNQTNADGTQSVIEIQFAKKKTVIRLNGEGSAVGK
jgi:hypothetical protein